MRFEQPLGQIVLINVNSSSSSNSNQLPIGRPTNGSSFAINSSSCTSSSSLNSSNKSNKVTTDYEEPQRLLLKQQTRTSLSRFTGGYEKPCVQPIRSNARLPPPTSSASVCCGSDGNSTTSDTNSVCSTNRISPMHTSHSTTSCSSPSSCDIYASPTSCDTLPHCAHSAFMSSTSSLTACSSSCSSSPINPIASTSQSIAFRQRTPDATVPPNPPQLDSSLIYQTKPSASVDTKSDANAYETPISLNRADESNVLTAPLSELEMQRIELFYRGQRTQVFVALACARLLFTRATLSANRRQSAPLESLWTEAAQGVPVLLLDKGGLRTRSKRQLRLCLADRKSAFPLFSDLINHLSDYKSMVNSTPENHMHVFYLSHDHRKMAGLQFVNTTAGQSFLNRMQLMTSIPANISLTGPKASVLSHHQHHHQHQSIQSSQSKIDECNSKKKRKKKFPKKSEISSPCLFQHLISLDQNDLLRLKQLTNMTLQASAKVDCSST